MGACDTFLQLLYSNLSFGLFILSILVSGCFFTRITNLANGYINLDKGKFIRIFTFLAYVMSFGFFINISVISYVTRKNIVDYSIYNNIYTFIYVVIATIIFISLGKQYKERGKAIFEYYIAKGVLFVFTVLFVWIVIKLISELSTKGFSLCTNISCKINSVIYIIFDILLVLFLSYTALMLFNSLLKTRKPRKQKKNLS